jgi:hypothetical protein
VFPGNDRGPSPREGRWPWDPTAPVPGLPAPAPEPAPNPQIGVEELPPPNTSEPAPLPNPGGEVAPPGGVISPAGPDISLPPMGEDPRTGEGFPDPEIFGRFGGRVTPAPPEFGDAGPEWDRYLESIWADSYIRNMQGLQLVDSGTRQPPAGGPADVNAAGILREILRVLPKIVPRVRPRRRTKPPERPWRPPRPRREWDTEIDPLKLPEGPIPNPGAWPQTFPNPTTPRPAPPELPRRGTLPPPRPRLTLPVPQPPTFPAPEPLPGTGRPPPETLPWPMSPPPPMPLPRPSPPPSSTRLPRSPRTRSATPATLPQTILGGLLSRVLTPSPTPSRTPLQWPTTTPLPEPLPASPPSSLPLTPMVPPAPISPPTLTMPLTQLDVGLLPSLQPQSQRERCECKTPAKRRKCRQRAAVKWAGGPRKGQLAGSRCYSFQRE